MLHHDWEEIPQNNSGGEWEEIGASKEPKDVPISNLPQDNQYNPKSILDALGSLESNGDYRAVGQPVRGKRAYGKYQIMEQNIPEWSEKYLGRPVSLEEFKSNPEIQEKIAEGKINELIAKGYGKDDIASIWNSGRPLKGNKSKDGSSGVSVSDYVKRFNEFYDRPENIKAKKEHLHLYKAAQYIEESPNLKPWVEGLEGLVNAAQGATIGGGESLVNAGISTANAPIDLANLFGANAPRIPKADLSRFLQNPQNLTTRTGYEGGKIGGEIAGAMVPFNALGKIPKLGNEASRAANFLRASIAGGLTGDEGYGGRSGSAAIGGIGGGIGAKLTNKALSESILRNSNRAKQESSERFNKVFNRMDESDIAVPEGRFDYNELKEAIPRSERKRLDRYAANPTMENAHRAQSALGTKIRNLEKSKEANPGGFLKDIQLESMRDAKKSIIKGMQQTFKEKGGEKLSSAYKNARKEHLEKVVPYNTKSLMQYKNKKLFAKDLIKNLNKNAEFKLSKVGQAEKMLQARKTIDSILGSKLAKYAGAGVVGGLGFKEASDKGLYNGNE